MTALPGINGSLFPRQFLVDGLEETQWHLACADLDRQRRRFLGWWDRVAATCGPATGIRALFDVVAMPLAGMAGFRARDAEFDRLRAVARLETTAGAAVGLIVLPWAARPSGIWRDLTDLARRIGADWTIVIAPPFVSIVPTRGSSVRRSVDFRLPDALDVRPFSRFLTMCGAQAFERRPNRPDLLSQLVARGVTFQDRVRADLQRGVVEALDALESALDTPHARSAGVARFDEALTLVYRVLFLLFAESRDLVPRGHATYGPSYSIASLCRTALTGQQNVGLWEGLAAITRLSRTGCQTDDLIVRPFNGRLFARAAAPSLEAHRPARLPTRSSKANDDAIGQALSSLASRPAPGGRQEIVYADLGVEQLGAVYERVLDLDPAASNRRPRTSPAHSRHSQRRKESGTFYTPQALADFVVRRTLAPLVAGVPAETILTLRVVDPAMGSGAFLVAACRFLAGAYERALIDDGQAAPSDIDEDERASIRRLVAERCLAGVDANPLAVQLARLSLWLATLAQGKPLGFLDHRLRVGNSLVGASPDDLTRLEPAGRARSRATAQLPLHGLEDLEVTMREISRPLGELARRDDTVRDVRMKEAIWSRLSGSRSPLEPWRLACSFWCARWFWPGGTPPSPAETRAAIDALLNRDTTLGAGQIAVWARTVRDLSARERFFHWPLEFADVFYDDSGLPRPRAGFDAVIGNPPWEMVRKEAGDDAREGAGPLVRFVRGSGLYPSCGRGHLNLYQPFLERALSLIHPEGRAGVLLPWGIAGDDGAAKLRERLLDRSRVHTVVGFDNAEAIFPVHRGLRFLLVVASPGGRTGEIRSRFGVRALEEIERLPARESSLDATAYPVRLTPDLLGKVGGAARRIPDLRDVGQLAFLRALMDKFASLGSTASGWSARFGRELNATEDRASFGTTGLPVIEGKHIGPFVVAIDDAANRIPPDRARRRLPDPVFEHARLAYRDVSSVSNRLSLIAAIVPPGVVTTHTLFCLRTQMPLVRQHFLCALFNSYVLNAVVRMLMGGHVTTTLIEGLPVPSWTGDPRQRRIALLAHRIACGTEDPAAHAELQASIARLYTLDSQTFRAVLDTFPLVLRQDRDRALEALANAR